MEPMGIDRYLPEASQVKLLGLGYSDQVVMGEPPAEFKEIVYKQLLQGSYGALHFRFIGLGFPETPRYPLNKRNMP